MRECPPQRPWNAAESVKEKATTSSGLRPNPAHTLNADHAYTVVPDPGHIVSLDFGHGTLILVIHRALVLINSWWFVCCLLFVVLFCALAPHQALLSQRFSTARGAVFPGIAPSYVSRVQVP